MFIGNLIKKYKRATPKQFILSGVFMLALAGTIGLGLANRPSAAAFTGDCDNNAIMRCGAANKSIFISKVQSNNGNTQYDLKGIYNHFGLSSGLYGDFESYAQYGTFHRDGRITVGSHDVAYNAHSMGRHSFGGSKPYSIGGVGTYYYGTPSQRWASGTSSIPVMVWFDDEGGVKMVVMNPCGNPVPYFDKKKPVYSCDMLNKHIVDGKKNTYQFSADASNNDLANAVKFTYSYNDGNGWKVFDTTTSEGTKTKEITFEKSSKVKVEVEFVFLHGKKKTVSSTACEKEIGVVKEEFLYVCDALIGTARDNTNRKFRFTVFTKQSNNVSVDSADFTLDGNITTKGVTDKDDDGNFYKDYEFNDTKTHTVSVIVNFTADGKKVTSKEGGCVAEVTPEEEPKCPYNPELPVDSPKCKPPVEKCVPEGKEDENCELPSTGPAGVAGLVAGVTAAGAVGHRLFMNRRRG